MSSSRQVSVTATGAPRISVRVRSISKSCRVAGAESPKGDPAAAIGPLGLAYVDQPMTPGVGAALREFRSMPAGRATV
jgi:hypothetical protein